MLLTCFILLGLSLNVRSESLLILGDSISAGYGFSVDKGWVALLEQRLQKEDLNGKLPNTVINASVSGETTSGALSRLPKLLSTHKPTWVIVELGGNDGLRGYPPTSMQRNLKKMVSLSRQAGAEVMLFGMKLPPNYGAAYSKAFEGVFQATAKEQGVPLIPFFLEKIALESGSMQPDGIHPVASVQGKMLEGVWPCLQAWFMKEQDVQSICLSSP